jgi:hypothetical protein
VRPAETSAPDPRQRERPYDIGQLSSCIGSGGAVYDESANFPDFVTKLVQAEKMEKDHLKEMGHRAARQFDGSLRAAEVELMHLAGDLLSKQG